MDAVEQMMYGQSDAVPWHGKGVTISDAEKTDVRACISKSGLDWAAELEELVTVAHARKNASNIESNISHKAVVRSTDRSILGVVGPRYKPLQNIEAFDWFQPFLDAGTCKLHTAGSLFHGRKVWVLAELAKNNSVVAKDDEVKKFILLSNSHDGTTSVRVGFNPIRVVCFNTLSMAISSSLSQLIRIRHSSQVKHNLESIREIMDEANVQFEATAEQYQHLASRHINVGDLHKYVKIVLKVDNITDDKIKTRTRNTIDKIVGLCESGRGNTNPAVRNTWWTAYNGFTEYLNHYKGRNIDNRLNNIWFGTDIQTSKEAFKKAMEMAS